MVVQQSEDVQSLSNYSEMPYPAYRERKGPVTDKMLEKFCAADMEDEYCALPFNHDVEYPVSHYYEEELHFLSPGQVLERSQVCMIPKLA